MPGKNTIDSFLSQLKKYEGLARLARYEVILTPPASLSGISKETNEISLLCNTIAMPGHDLSTHSAKYGIGVATEMVNGHAYEGTIATTFYLDRHMDVKFIMDLWQNAAVSTANNTVSYYKDNDGNFNYAGSMEIWQLGSQETLKGSHSDTILKNIYGSQAGASSGPRNENIRQKIHHVPGKIYGIKVEEVYPATIGEIEYAYATVDEIALLTVNFQYKRWKPLQLPSFLTHESHGR